MSEVSTAILLFTRTAREEAAAKSWSGRAKNRQLAKLLIRNSRRVAQKSGFPIIVHDNQQGNSFAEKLHYAFQEAFKKGFEHIICIGNDTPSLTAKTLKKAASALHNGQKWVLGPSQDGGVYLIGMRKDCFQQIEFDTLPWQSGQLFQELKASLGQRNPGITLSIKQDLDDAKDISLMLFRLSHQLDIIQALFTLFQNRPLIPHFIPLFSLSKEIPLMAGVFRGPPKRG